VRHLVNHLAGVGKAMNTSNQTQAEGNLHFKAYFFEKIETVHENHFTFARLKT
jgi:hypothetical protein